MEALRYADFSAELRRRVVAQRIPVSGSIEITRRCPLKCVHCYNNLPLGNLEARSGELTYEEHCRLLDEIAEAGCLWLLYTGGEIFARNDFLDIYTYAKQKGFLITLFTNGTLITEAIADHLAQWRPFAIEITIYGSTPATHDRITGVPGSYQQCMRGIRLLMERHLPLALKTMAITANKHEIWEMKRLVEEDLGLRFRFDATINCRVDCSQSPLAVRLTAPEIVELDLHDPRRIAEWKRFAERFHGPVHSPEQSGEMYHCGGGINSFGIDPYGKMSVCLLSLSDSYDLRAGTFAEGWRTHIPKVRHKKITRQTKCVGCAIKAMCGMCPGHADLEHGAPEEPVDFLCELAHLRACALDIDIPPHGECVYCGKTVGTSWPPVPLEGEACFAIEGRP